MYRILIPSALLSLGYFIWNISTTSYHVRGGWDIDSAYFFLQLLYWPAVVGAWATGAYAAACLRKQRVVAGLALLLALPMIAYSLYHPRYATLKKWHAIEAKKSEWWDGSGILCHLLQKYVRYHWNELRWPGADEEIDPSGFIAYLRTYPTLYYWSRDGRGPQIRIKENTILSPWGAPLIIGVDRDGDGYLNIGGQRSSLKPGYADPWGDGNFGYRIGVGLLPAAIPESIFESGANYMKILDDGTFYRLYEYEEADIQRR